MSMAMATHEYLTVKEAAALLRYDEDTVWRKIRRGEIPGVVKHGRMIRIRAAALYAPSQTTCVGACRRQ